ncbi:MAG: membrane protein insertion efficiency factor YidD [Gammaproteobacteria bacterium]|nr:membrane protein insertion efficiency factor YidD [Gammaproteobacteria bacterium]MBT5601335.1 membrane protein insertion efficiency factor YidD [Gammaproteobacteria bacterium]
MKRCAIKIILLYQWTLSSLLGQNCRFYPSCSHYAIESIERFGVIKAVKLICIRISKCHPFHPGGVDLVPQLQQAETSK